MDHTAGLIDTPLAAAAGNLDLDRSVSLLHLDSGRCADSKWHQMTSQRLTSDHPRPTESHALYGYVLVYRYSVPQRTECDAPPGTDVLQHGDNTQEKSLDGQMCARMKLQTASWRSDAARKPLQHWPGESRVPSRLTACRKPLPASRVPPGAPQLMDLHSYQL
ncbi:hypothetical protein GN956_G12889 [Arapaima gigas]